MFCFCICRHWWCAALAVLFSWRKAKLCYVETVDPSLQYSGLFLNVTQARLTKPTLLLLWQCIQSNTIPQAPFSLQLSSSELSFSPFLSLWLPLVSFRREKKLNTHRKTQNPNANSAMCLLCVPWENFAKGFFEEAKGLLMNMPFIDLWTKQPLIMWEQAFNWGEWTIVPAR